MRLLGVGVVADRLRVELDRLGEDERRVLLGARRSVFELPTRSLAIDRLPSLDRREQLVGLRCETRAVGLELVSDELIARRASAASSSPPSTAPGRGREERGT